jgi:spore coat protein H
VRLPSLSHIVLLSAVLSGCDRHQDATTRTPATSRESDRRQLRNPASHPLFAKVVASPGPADAGLSSEKPSASRLPLYELRMEAKELRALERNPGSNETHPATFLAAGEVYEGVGVRFRGEWARSWPKKPLKIFFTRDQPFQGHHSLNLNSAWRDAAFAREVLAYHVYAACGVPASRSRLVRLNVNGQFRGVYVEVEQVDKTFLRRFDLKGAGLFKATSDENKADERDLGSETSFAAHYDNESQKTNDLHDLQSFCRELARSTNALDFFTRRVDLEKYINYLAATVLIQHWDGFNKNHFLVYDRSGSGKWFVVPWDLDRTFGDHWNPSSDTVHLPILLGTRRAPGVTGWNRLQDRFFSDPTLHAQFLDRLEKLLEQEFTSTKLFPLLDRFEAELGADAALDRRRWPGPAGDVHDGMAELKRNIERRRAWLQNQLEQLRQAKLPR